MIRLPIRFVLLFVGAVTTASAGAFPRSVERLAEGWTFRGAAVSVPHTWNADDGADGLPPAAREFRAVKDREKGFLARLGAWRSQPASTERSYCREANVYLRRLPALKPGSRVFFKCDGASVTAEVYVNGTLVGRHLGAYSAFCYELTDLLRPDAESELAVVVDNRPNPDVPTVSADFTVFGGLYRDCWLIVTDRDCIDPTYYGSSGVFVSTDAEKGVVKVETRVSGCGRPVRYAVDGVGEWTEPAFAIPAFERWSPANPKVYSLTVELANGDAVTVPFGFRDVAFDASGAFVLNGNRFALRGVNRHQDRAGCGWAVSAADEDEDFRLIREMGANTVRTAHYPQSAHVYDLTDRLGLVAWVELPLTNTLSPTPAFRATVDEMIREMILQLGNHPSICLWSVFNELQHDWAPQLREAECAELITRFAARFRELDATRPVVAASCTPEKRLLNRSVAHLAFNFYPGWYVDEKMAELLVSARKLNDVRSVGVSEYGAGGSVRHHQWPAERPGANNARFHPEEYQALCHADQYADLRRDPAVWGSWVWAMFDFAADTREEGDHDGINDKGLVTRDRKVKKEAYSFYQANWTKTPVLCLVGSKVTEVVTNEVPVVVFSNRGEVTLRVNGVTVGTAVPDDVCRVVWDSVTLVPGDNLIEVSAGSETAVARWHLK